MAAELDLGLRQSQHDDSERCATTRRSYAIAVYLFDINTGSTFEHLIGNHVNAPPDNNFYRTYVLEYSAPERRLYFLFTEYMS